MGMHSHLGEREMLRRTVDDLDNEAVLDSHLEEREKRGCYSDESAGRRERCVGRVQEGAGRRWGRQARNEGGAKRERRERRTDSGRQHTSACKDKSPAASNAERCCTAMLTNLEVESWVG